MFVLVVLAHLRRLGDDGGFGETCARQHEAKASSESAEPLRCLCCVQRKVSEARYERLSGGGDIIRKLMGADFDFEKYGLGLGVDLTLSCHAFADGLRAFRLESGH